MLKAFLQESVASSLIECALIMPALLLLAVGMIDVGRGAYAAIEVNSAAEAGALYGTFNNADATGMQHAAILDASDIIGLSALASYGCECSDGSSVTVSCASTPSCATVVAYVQVRTQATYVPILNYPGIPSPMVFKGFATMRAGY